MLRGQDGEHRRVGLARGVVQRQGMVGGGGDLLKSVVLTVAELRERVGDEAREALGRGIAAASQHGHPSMAAELEERLDELGA